MADSKTPTYNALLNTLITNFNSVASSWGTDIDAYLKGSHDKGITIQDWNTLIGLVQQARYFVMAVKQLLPNLDELAANLENDLENDLRIKNISASDTGVLTVELGSGIRYNVGGAFQRFRVNSETGCWEYTLDGGNTWTSLGSNAVPSIRINELTGRWEYSPTGAADTWVDSGVEAQGPPGATPEREVDYWTDADKAAIYAETKKYVEDAILTGEW